ncbi:MAG: hypothetical protein ACRD1X_14275 [Vicinamibacteria bacterium]
MARAYQHALRERAVAFESELDDVLAGLKIELLECSIEVVDDSRVVSPSGSASPIPAVPGPQELGFGAFPQGDADTPCLF